MEINTLSQFVKKCLSIDVEVLYVDCLMIKSILTDSKYTISIRKEFENRQENDPVLKTAGITSSVFLVSHEISHLIYELQNPNNKNLYKENFGMVFNSFGKHGLDLERKVCGIQAGIVHSLLGVSSTFFYDLHQGDKSLFDKWYQFGHTLADQTKAV